MKLLVTIDNSLEVNQNLWDNIQRLISAGVQNNNNNNHENMKLTVEMIISMVMEAEFEKQQHRLK